MNADLREALATAVEEDVTAVRVDAAAAWTEGRRRRSRSRAVGGIAAALAAVGTAVVLTRVETPVAPEPATPSNEIVDKHPGRLEYAYRDDDLPEVTGPLAGVVERSGESASGWYAVSPEGHLWLIDDLDRGSDTPPALSPDGTHLGYLSGNPVDATWVITDQRDGTEVAFPQVGTGIDSPEGSADAPFFAAAQSPSYWSPDGTALMVRVGLMEPNLGPRGPLPDPAAAILGSDGSFTLVPALGGGKGALPLGWVGDSRIVLASFPEAGRTVRVWIYDVEDERKIDRFHLERRGVDREQVDQWFGSVSYDGGLLATLDPGARLATRYFSLDSPLKGRLRSSTTAPGNAADSCLPVWASDELYLPTMTDRDGESTILVRANGGTTILADPRLDIVCSTWARSALDGPEDTSWGSRLFGDDQGWLSWHWREVTLASTALIVSLLGAVVLRVRRRRAA